ncbi:DUF4279 domain-containing protein [Streptomyces litchfieldiae]|uniref:DUF4279 domain-containing protein n=1 Tax=Streptomyces litchfieldiae TaxID=3075543 RepID=A0ABU2MYF0_9ACTN|nr:DUF4279 domain-containing protein [Streptomyces sp. DSM 44938]MDT0346683.1 DUF4279 domain-containing protein [Streptomyces sp. DSM 44938]
MTTASYEMTERSWVDTDATLVVRKDDLDPEAVSTRLALAPTATRLPGPDRWNPAGDPAGLWLLRCADRALGLPEQLDRVVDAVFDRAEVLRELAAEGYDVTLSVFGRVGPGAMLELPPETALRIASLGIPLELRVSNNER